MQFAQLLFVDVGRRIGEQALRALCLGEGDYVADRFSAGHHGDDAVQAEGQPAMRRCAVFQCIEQETKFCLLFFRSDAECLKYLCLHFRTMDAHRTAAHFPAVQGEVISLGQARAGVGRHEFFVAVLGAGEGVMAGIPAFIFFVIFEHREINHPQWPPGFAAEIAFVMPQLAAQCAECVIDDFGLVGAEENQVTRLRAGALDDGLQRLLVQVLDDRRLQTLFIGFAGVIHLDVGQTLGAVNLDKLGIGVDFAARQGFFAGPAAGYAQRGDAAARAGRAAEYLEADVSYRIGDIHQFQRDAQVGLVGTITLHCFGMRHAREGVGQVDIQRSLEHAANHCFHQVGNLHLGQK